MSKHRVVITGGGAISSLGNDWCQIASSLKSTKNSVCTMDDWDQYPQMNTRLAAPVNDFSLPSYYKAKQKRSMGRVAQMAVVATENALKQALLSEENRLSNGRTGVAYGSATGSSDAALEFFSMLEDKSMDRLNSTTYLRMMSHSAAVNISIIFGTQGRIYTTNSACTAGSQAIGYAYEAIRDGVQDIMITGGAEELCPTHAAVFDTIYAASTNNDQPKNTPRPFDKERDGLVLGEGACTLILESLDHAKARGAKIFAEIIGFATNTDGRHAVRPSKKTVVKVMEACLNNAGKSSDEVGYISAHATATEQGDIIETEATQEVFGSNIAISSLKSYTGHTLGACGSFEAWASIMMMNEGWFAPTLNLESVDSRCANLDYIIGDCRQIDTSIIMSNNFAFGGINTSLLFSRYD